MLYNTCTSDSSKIIPPIYFHKSFNKYRGHYNSLRPLAMGFGGYLHLVD